MLKCAQDLLAFFMCGTSKSPVGPSHPFQLCSGSSSSMYVVSMSARGGSGKGLGGTNVANYPPTYSLLYQCTQVHIHRFRYHSDQSWCCCASTLQVGRVLVLSCFSPCSILNQIPGAVGLPTGYLFVPMYAKSSCRSPISRRDYSLTQDRRHRPLGHRSVSGHRRPHQGSGSLVLAYIYFLQLKPPYPCSRHTGCRASTICVQRRSLDSQTILFCNSMSLERRVQPECPSRLLSPGC